MVILIGIGSHILDIGERHRVNCVFLLSALLFWSCYEMVGNADGT